MSLPPSRRFVVGAVIASVTAALGLSACTGSTPRSASASLPFPTPLATSVQTGAGTWATVPMGHLDDPTNTFWQLFFRPSNAERYSNQVEATATATNGGLVLADRPGQGLLVGIRPSQNLHFTPMIASADGGASWTSGLLDAPLAPSPSALAVSSNGDVLGIATSHGSSEVMASPGGFSSWRTLLTAKALAAGTSGRRCAPEAFSAVGYLGTSILLGASCTRAGAGPIFVSAGSGWVSTGPRTPTSAAEARAEALGFYSEGTGAATLVGYSTGAEGEVVASWTTDGRSWRSSAPLPMRDGDRVASYGPVGANGLFVLLSGSGGSESLYEIDDSGSTWSQLPTPPPTTVTIASGPGGSLDALAVDDTVLTVWDLGPSGSWTSAQKLDVPIQFGSSN